MLPYEVNITQEHFWANVAPVVPWFHSQLICLRIWNSIFVSWSQMSLKPCPAFKSGIAVWAFKVCKVLSNAVDSRSLRKSASFQDMKLVPPLRIANYSSLLQSRVGSQSASCWWIQSPECLPVHSGIFGGWPQEHYLAVFQQYSTFCLVGSDWHRLHIIILPWQQFVFVTCMHCDQSSVMENRLATNLADVYPHFGDIVLIALIFVVLVLLVLCQVVHQILDLASNETIAWSFVRWSHWRSMNRT